MAWPLDIGTGPFANTTLVGVGQEFLPHTIMERLPNGKLKAYGVAASLLTNATWALGIKLEFAEPSDNFYGSMTPDGGFQGALLDLVEKRADVSVSPMARLHPADDLFDKSLALGTVQVIMLSGMKQAFQKSSTSVISEEMITEVFPVLVAIAIVCVVLSSLFNAMANEDSFGSYADLFFMFYYPTLFYETSHALVASNNRITYSSKVVFGFWLLGTLVISTFIQSTLKSSFMVVVETERIRNNADLLDRPNLLPLMHDDLQYFVIAINVARAEELVARWLKFRPDSVVPLPEYYTKETMDKLVSKRGVLYTDEFGAIYELPRLCPLIKGYYLYQSMGLSATQLSFYYRPGINLTLVREIDKRCRWLMEAKIPWIPRHLMDPTNQPCFVKPHRRETMSNSEATHLSAEDLFGVWILLGVGALIACVGLAAELVICRLSRIFRFPRKKISRDPTSVGRFLS